MNITWITYDWSTDTGGKGVAGNAFINHLISKGHSVHLIDLEMGAQRAFDTARLNPKAHIEPWWVGGMLGVIVRLPLLFVRALQSELVLVGAAPNIDLVALLALVPARIIGGGTVVRLEYTNPKTYLDHSKLKPLYHILGKLLFPRLDRTVAPAQGLIEQIIQHYNVKPEATRVCPWPCVPTDLEARMHEAVPEALFTTQRPKVLAITVMRLSLQDKDFDTLLRAFSIIHQQTGAELAVLGAGDPAPIQELIAREHLEGKVHLLGERKNPYAYVAKADLFLFASKYEGSPLVIAEALACGCPVIATDCDFGPRELINDGTNGFLIPVRNPEVLARRAIELIGKKDLQERFREAGKKGSKIYAVPAAGDIFNAILEETRQS